MTGRRTWRWKGALAAVVSLTLAAGACGGDDDDGGATPTDAGNATTDADTGDADTGDADTGDADTGDADTGDADTGDADTGDGDADADGGTAPSDPDGSTADVQEGGVLRVAQNLTVQQGQNLDPRVSSSNLDLPVLAAVYSPLAAFASDRSTIVPLLAESWNVVDSQTIEMTLRDDALFHDGRPVTSADVKATIEATRDNAAGGLNTVNPNLRFIEEIEVVDDLNFIVHLTEPAVASFFEIIVDRGGMVVPADAGPEQDTEPIGNGPFRVTQFTLGERVVTERFSDHFLADQMHLDGIEFIHLEEGTPQDNALLAGDVQWTLLSQPGFQQASQQDDLGTIGLFSDGGMIYLDMCKDYGAVFEDIRVRQAFAHAIDVDVLNQIVYEGEAIPADFQISLPTGPLFNADIADTYPYDPDRARELLEEAGVVGQDASIWVLTRFAAFQEAALVISEAMREVGLNVEVVGGDDITGDYWDPSNSGNPNYDGMVVRNQRVGVEKVGRWFTPGSQANTCTWENQEMLDTIGTLAGLEPGSDESIAAWHRLNEIVVEELPLINLVFEPFFFGWSNDVVGVVDGELVSAGELHYQNQQSQPRWEFLAFRS